MSHSNILQEMKELRELQHCIAERTGYKTKVNIIRVDDEGDKKYQVHVSADDRRWKYINIPFEDVDTSYNDFMFSLLQCPSDFNSYDVGSYGLLLEKALDAHDMGDIGYFISYGELAYFNDEEEIVTLCKCKDITKLSVEIESGAVELIIIAKNKKITISDDGYSID